MESGRSRCARWMLVGALVLAGLPSEAGELRVYKPRSRTPAELAPVAESLLGADGAAVADPGGRALVLRGSRDALERALAVLEELDVPPRMWRVESQIVQLSDLEALGVSIEGWLEFGSLRIGRIPDPAGLPSLAPGVAIRAEAPLEERERRLEASVAVLDGRTAELFTGTLHPERTRRLRSGPRGTRLEESTVWVPAESGLRVTPRGRPDGSVDLELEPGVAERRPDGVYERTGGAMRVRVRPGESVVVAEIDASEAAAAHDRFGSLERRDAARRTAIVVRVHPVE